MKLPFINDVIFEPQIYKRIPLLKLDFFYGSKILSLMKDNFF